MTVNGWTVSPFSNFLLVKLLVVLDTTFQLRPRSVYYDQFISPLNTSVNLTPVITKLMVRSSQQLTKCQHVAEQ